MKPEISFFSFNRFDLQLPMRLSCGLVILFLLGFLFEIPSAFGQKTDSTTEEATHQEIDSLKVKLKSGGKVETIAMDHQGRLLVGVTWIADTSSVPERKQNGNRKPVPRPKTAQERLKAYEEKLKRIREKNKASSNRTGSGRNSSGKANSTHQEPSKPVDKTRRQGAIKIIDSSGKELATWSLGHFLPKMIEATSEGTVYIGDAGRIVAYDAKGNLLRELDCANILTGQFTLSPISGMTTSEDYLFVAFGNGWSLRATEEIVRFKRDFTEPKLIVSRQFGCCAHLDLQVEGKSLLVAENSRHRVNRFTFDGEKLGSWGRRDRVSLKGFAACCNPCNFDLSSDGFIYTAESGVGRVKKYRPDGTFAGLVGYVDTTKFDRGSKLASMSCYIPMEVSADRKRIYVLDIRANIIRVLEKKSD